MAGTARANGGKRSGASKDAALAADSRAQRRSGTQSIERAVALLRALAPVNRDGATASQLAAATRLDRGTASRMLRCMAAEGLLSYSEDSRRFFMGPFAFELGAAAGRRRELRTVCRDAMWRLAHESEDTAFLLARAGLDTVCLDRVEGSYPVKTLLVDIGMRRPLGLGAAGISILSAMPPADAETVIAYNERRLAHPEGVFERVNIADLRKLVAQARAAEGAVTYLQKVSGVVSLAVPLITGEGRVIAALSLSAIRSRMTPARRKQLFALLSQEARRLAPELDISML